MAQQDPVRTGVISTVVGTVIVAALTEVWPPVKTALAWCWAQLKWLFKLLTADYSTPGWLLLAFGLLTLITTIRWLRTMRWQEGKEEPGFLAYTTDIFYGARWRWQWSGQDIANLWCFCPSCDSELVYDDSSCRDVLRRLEPRTNFVCEHCGHIQVASIKGGDKSYALSAIQREIRRKLRTGQAPSGLSPEARVAE